MINGAMEVFARFGYAKASTDEMVKVSAVSKGLWFHYFENKKGLYDFVTGYGVKYAIMEFEKMQANIERAGDKLLDPAVLLMHYETVKISLINKYPYLPLLLYSIMTESDTEAIELTKDIRQSYIACMESLMAMGDFTGVKENEDFIRISHMLKLTIENLLVECYKEPVFRAEYYLMECQEYLKLVRKFI